MVLSIVFYEIVDFKTIIYALYCTPIQAFPGIPTRDEFETPPEPSGAIFAGKLTPCYEQSRIVVCYSLIVMPSVYICLSWCLYYVGLLLLPCFVLHPCMHWIDV